MKEELEIYIDKKENFSKMKLTKKIIYVSYFYLKITKKDSFKAKDILESFDFVAIHRPSNIYVFLDRLVKKKIYIKYGDSFKLERNIFKQLESEFKLNNNKNNLAMELRKILQDISNETKKNYLNEAIICYENDCKRAAIIMTWLFTIDHLYDYVLNKKLTDFNNALVTKNIKLKIVKSKDDFSDIKESDFIEICRIGRILSGNAKKILDEKLVIRNICSHPNDIKLTDSKIISFIEDLVNNVILKYN